MSAGSLGWSPVVALLVLVAGLLAPSGLSGGPTEAAPDTPQPSATVQRGTGRAGQSPTVLGDINNDGAVLIAGLPGVAGAQPPWLDAPVAGWNSVGSALPRAVPVRASAATCSVGARPVETTEDAALVAAGWTLYDGYQAGWGLRLVWALSSYDETCRPLGYQAFVFADGLFAGTVAPMPMNFQTDGSALSAQLVGGDVTATFARYGPNDPPCCPSRPAVTVGYRVERRPTGPLLEPVYRMDATR